MKFPVKKFFIVYFIVVAFLISFGTGVFVGRSTTAPKIIFGISNPEEGKPANVDFSLFWRAWAEIQEKFVDKGKLDNQKMLFGAISGMVKSLGDPYTVFMSPEERKRFQEEVEGSFEGVGMEIGEKKGELTVIAPLEGTPAQRAGLRAGDKILKINDTLTADLTIDEAVNLIRGPRGTEVTLTVSRKDWDMSKEIKVTRDVIQVPSIKWEIKEGNIAYIKLYQFSEKAANDFRNATFEISNSPAKKIILDLRNNSGGYLEVSQYIASLFLNKGQVVVIEDFGGKKEKEEYKSDINGPLKDYPIVVLINQGTASAAEILAGALRDNQGVKLIGEKSFGKGSVQELEELPGGSSLKITIARWLTPKGNLITDVGLEPDIKVELTDKDYEEGKDPQLDKAIEIVKQF